MQARFTTFERVQLREITIVKRNGRRSILTVTKLERSFEIALRKREVDTDDVARAINEIVRKLESYADGDVPSEKVGELVMSSLHTLDQVAYVRYASVYRNFREAKILKPLSKRSLVNSAVSFS